MAGSAFLTAIVVVGLLLALLVTPFVGIPLVILGLGAVFLVPLWKKARDTSIAQADGGPTGAATTAEASYDPTQQPR